MGAWFGCIEEEAAIEQEVTIFAQTEEDHMECGGLAFHVRNHDGTWKSIPINRITQDSTTMHFHGPGLHATYA